MKTPKRTIWFVRHGERMDNIDKDWKKTAKRWDDPPLSQRGHMQAHEVGTRLADEGVRHIIVSPFTRCIQTAAAISSHFNNTDYKVHVEPGFGESLNACNDPPGRPPLTDICEMINRVATDYEPVYTTLPPEYGGDAGCSERVGITLKKVIKRFPTGNLLIVSHGSPIAACHLALFDTWKYVGQCTIGKVVQTGEELRCEFYGDKSHLSDKENLHEEQSPIKFKMTQEHLKHWAKINID